jgi:hypothetical protein
MKAKIKQREREKREREREMGERNESDEEDDETGPGERGKSRCLGQLLCFARRRFPGLFLLPFLRGLCISSLLFCFCLISFCFFFRPFRAMLFFFSSALL